MSIKDIVFYQIVDPITGSVTKDVGWTVVRALPKHVRQLANGVVSIVENPHTSEEITFSPPEASKQSITEEAFNSLSTEGESLSIRTRRQANLKKIAQATLQDTLDSELGSFTEAQTRSILKPAVASVLINDRDIAEQN